MNETDYKEWGEKYIHAVRDADATWMKTKHKYFLITLLMYSNKFGWSFPSQERLAKENRTSPGALRRIIKDLEDNNVLKVIHRQTEHKPNKYKILMSEIVRLGRPDRST